MRKKLIKIEQFKKDYSDKHKFRQDLKTECSLDGNWLCLINKTRGIMNQFIKTKHKRLTYFTDGTSVKIKKDDLRQYRKEEFEREFLEPYGFIYIIRNLKNNKVYIGQTIQNPFSRYNSHLRDSDKEQGFYLHKAISKYGKSNFEFHVLKDCKDQKEMNKFESLFIKRFQSCDSNKGYNLANVNENGSNPMTGSSLYNLWVTKYGEETANVKLEEFKEKQRDVGKRSDRSYLSFKGYKHTDENKKNLSEKRTGSKNPMFNKNPREILIEKYGSKVGNELWKNQYQSRARTRIQNNQLKKENDVEVLLW